MDPNEVLKNARKAMASYQEQPSDSAAEDLIDAFEALDGWLSKGGFLPSAWASKSYSASGEPGEAD